MNNTLKCISRIHILSALFFKINVLIVQITQNELKFACSLVGSANQASELLDGPLRTESVAIY